MQKSFVAAILAVTLIAHHSAAAPAARHTMTGDVSGTVTDALSGSPIAGAQVSITQAGHLVANRLTDAFGRYTVHNLNPGVYGFEARYIGYAPLSITVTVGSKDTTGVDFKLQQATVALEAVTVTAGPPAAVDTRTADQTLQVTTEEMPPTVTPSQVLQQSIAGAVRAPTGEVHIRGQHAEYTYYIDGVPVPSGVSGSLNETFDPKVLDKMEFQTGGWDAEYGDKNAAVVNVTTRIPAGGFHTSFGSYAGQYDAASTQGNHNLDGQNLTLSTNAGAWGFLLSGARQYSDMRQEPVVFDTATKKVQNFHNNGFDYYGFSKIQYAPNGNDIVALDMSLSQTLFNVPYDSSGSVFADDRQKDNNSFVNLGWHHLMTAGAHQANELFVGAFYRHGGLRFIPSARDSATFTFFPDTTTAYNLSEQRHFDILGAKADYTLHPLEDLELKTGAQFSSTSGHENFSSVSSSGAAGPQSNSGLSGNDLGVYAQGAYTPVEWFELRTGLRYDTHSAPFASTQSQLSPRVRLNFYPRQGTTLYAYYGRMFIPTNVEDLRAITSAALGAAATPQPTLPERDDFYEIGWAQQWSDAPFQTKLDAFHKHSSPGVDDNTVPGSAIVTEVNIANIWVTGIEEVIEFQPTTLPVNAWLNGAITHAYGLGPVTGGFFPIQLPSGHFDLDHDQRLSLTGGLTYTPVNHLGITATETYGSGLITAPCSNNCPYGTDLFDFNTGYHVKANYTTDLSVSYAMSRGQTVIRPQVYVTNLFNAQYLLKGAFFSGAWVGRPRSVQVRLNVAM